ncbi:RNA-binding S4 domain-containing protein [Plasmodiophora brassicae]
MLAGRIVSRRRPFCSLVRLNKALASKGICSRREADDYIRSGKVRVDGVVVDQLGSKVRPAQRIDLDQGEVNARRDLVTVLFHKPVGIVSSQAEPGERPARSFIELDAELAVCGRLDKMSHGLLVMTEDGALARRLIGGRDLIEKEYNVEYEGDELNHLQLDLLRNGSMIIEGVQIRRCVVDVVGDHRLQMILVEGRNQQIRRMLRIVGAHVTSLCRTRIGNVHLGDLQPGQWRLMQPGDVF